MNNDLISKSRAVEILKSLAYDKDMSDEEATVLCMAWGAISRLKPENAEIVRHAHWILEALGFDSYRYTTDYVFRCSECGLRANNKFPYCHCGCKMDLEVEE